MKKICLKLIRFYQKYISPMKGTSCCRFIPSCSEYAYQAFEKYGFFGAVRALEITREKARPDYFHPHFHCLFILKKGMKLDEGRKHITSFSYDDEDYKRRHRKKVDGQVSRYFGDFEILLQKIWRLRIEGVKVNKKNIENLSEGYSVICNNAKGYKK